MNKPKNMYFYKSGRNSKHLDEFLKKSGNLVLKLLLTGLPLYLEIWKNMDNPGI